MTIPNDPLHRWWADGSGENPEDISSLRTALVSVVAFGRQREPKVVGTGFFITSGPGAVVFVTAKHVLTPGVLGVQRPEALASLGNPFAARRLTQISLAESSLRLLWHDADGANMLSALHVGYNDVLDIACGVAAPATGTHFRPACIPLDTTMPAVGTKVRISTLNQRDVVETAEPQARTGHGQQLSFEFHVSLRVGVVTGVYPDGLNQYRFPCFTTSIPVVGGMSGGAVSVMRGEGALSACGVVCADASPAESFEDYGVEGRSIISCCWPALGMSLPTTFPPVADQPLLSLRDLMITAGLPYAGGLEHIVIESLPNGDYSIRNLLIQSASSSLPVR